MQPDDIEDNVKCVGITLSEEQKDWAEDRIRSAELSDRIDIQLIDYRELPDGLVFDKISSVGMAEHVGKPDISNYINHTSRLLADGGVGVIQSIGHMVDGPSNRWIRKYIFPGAYLPRLDELVHALGQADLDVIDVENLRIHYGMTVDRWIHGYEKVIDRVKQDRGEEFARMWFFYLNALSGGFKYGNMKLWQIVFTKGTNDHLELTRDHIYA